MNKKVIYLIAPIVLSLLFGYYAFEGGELNTISLALSILFLLHCLLLVYLYFIRKKKS